MKLPVAVLVILFGAAFARAQKQDPMLVKSHPHKSAATAQSVGPGAVAAVLNRKSGTASDLAKIERGPVNHPNASKPATAHSSVAKDFGLDQDDRNKSMKASRLKRVGRPSYRRKAS